MDRLDAVVTGATGFVGRWLVPLLTARGQHVGVLVRDARQRAAEYRAWVDAHGGAAARVRFFESDLGAPDLGLSPSEIDVLRTARDFHHAGAAMKFGLDLEEARRVNVEGARTFYRIASEAPRLRRVVHVGGFKIRSDGGVKVALDRLGGYERSKIEVDLLVRELEREGLPITRVQPAAIIGDSLTGETSQLWGFADLVRDLFHGRIPAVIGGEGWWMPLVTVDLLAKFIAGVPDLGDGAASEYLLVDDATPELGELLERMTRHLGVAAVRRTVPKAPLEWFLRMGGERLTGISPEAISFIGDERYDVHATKLALGAMGLEMPDIESAVLRNVDFLAATRFGKRARQTEEAGMKRVAGVPTFVEGAPAASDVLLLHGIPLDASSWDGVLGELRARRGAERLRAASADLPGLARTTKTTSDPATWMESLLAGHAGKPWIVAHSLGTRYAVEHADRHPDRVAGLVLVSPFFLQAPPPFFLRNATLGSLAFSLMRDADLVKLVGNEWADAPREWLSRPGARKRVAHALADAHAVRDELGRMMRALDMPVVIVAGERDPLVEDAGSAQVVTIAGTGHFPQLDKPAELAAAIARFVRPEQPNASLGKRGDTAARHALGRSLIVEDSVAPAHSREGRLAILSSGGAIRDAR